MKILKIIAEIKQLGNKPFIVRDVSNELPEMDSGFFNLIFPENIKLVSSHIFKINDIFRMGMDKRSKSYKFMINYLEKKGIEYTENNTYGTTYIFIHQKYFEVLN